MWWGRTATTFRGWFAVQRLGALVTGLDPGAFTFTVVNPQDTASLVVAVAESVKPGLYRADIPNTFFAAHGAGDYGIVVEVSDGPPPVDAVASRTFYVSDQDIDALASDITTALTGQGLTAEQAAKLLELHRLAGLDAAHILTAVNPESGIGSRTAGDDIEQSVITIGDTTTVQRL